MFENLQRLVPEPTLGLMTQFRADRSAHKVDLGIGVYRNARGDTPIPDCVRLAEQRVIAMQTTKTYIGALGREEFIRHTQEIALGAGHEALSAGRVRGIQTPGGCGALRLGAELVKTAMPAVRVFVGDPTWANHVPLLGGSGLALERYAYYDAARRKLLFDQMIDGLDHAAAGDVVLLHACCHNPSGCDPSPEQWEQLIDCLQHRRLVPFLDLAYQGFGENLDADVAYVRRIFEKLPEALLAISFSKNLGLYRERVGVLIVLGQSATHADAMQSNLMQIARSIYSMPPDHGAAIASTIFADPSLRRAWTEELGLMRERIASVRTLLTRSLREATGTESFDFLSIQRGMFSLLGIAPDAVVRLRERHHIYMTPDGRINIAGLNEGNIGYVAQAIAQQAQSRASRSDSGS